MFSPSRNCAPVFSTGQHVHAAAFTPGFLALMATMVMAGAITLTCVWTAFSEPELTGAQKKALIQKEHERRRERAVLVKQLTAATSDLTCIPARARHALTCDAVEYGILRKSSRFEVSLANTLPVVALSFHAGTEQQFTLKYGAPLSPSQRLAIVRSIKLA